MLCTLVGLGLERHIPARWLGVVGAVSERRTRPVCAARRHGFSSIVFPLIGSGSGGFHREQAKAVMLEEFQKLDLSLVVRLVVFRKCDAG